MTQILSVNALLVRRNQATSTTRPPDPWSAVRTLSSLTDQVLELHRLRVSTLRFLAELHIFIEHVSSLTVSSVTRTFGDDVHLVTLVGNLPFI